jgi:SpoVG
MRAFFSVELASGLILHDLRLMAGKNGFWIAMPAQRQLDRDGTPRTDANGRALYTQIVEFRDRSTADRFAAMVLALIREKHPGALGASEP